jgi:hypothetical protein
MLGPAAFFIAAFAVALGNGLRIRSERRHVCGKYENGCELDCANCGEEGCRERALPTDLTSNRELGAFIVKQCRRAAAFVWFVLKNMGALLKRFGLWLGAQFAKLPPLLKKIKAREGLQASVDATDTSGATDAPGATPTVGAGLAQPATSEDKPPEDKHD